MEKCVLNYEKIYLKIKVNGINSKVFKGFQN